MSDYSCLVVEDSPMMRQLLVFALARIKRINVTEAEDGVDALRKLATNRYDLIMSDINMPIMDGLKLVKRIRSDANHASTPIIIITTEGSTEDRQRAMASTNRAMDLLDTPIEAHPGRLSLDAQRVRGALELKDVTFAYRGRAPVLRNFSLTIESGTPFGSFVTV